MLATKYRYYQSIRRLIGQARSFLIKMKDHLKSQNKSATLIGLNYRIQSRFTLFSIPNTLERHQKIYCLVSRHQIPYLSKSINLLSIKSTLFTLSSFDIIGYGTESNRKARIKTLSSIQPCPLLTAYLYSRHSIMLTQPNQDPLYDSYISLIIYRRINLLYYIRMIAFTTFSAIKLIFPLKHSNIQTKTTLKDELFQRGG